MRILLSALRILFLATLPTYLGATESTSASSFGNIAIPAPAKPADATECVEPVEVMRRDHMKLLLHQRDETVHKGERDSKYSLTGCIDCHNPGSANGEVIRYENPQHFCAGCHAYASVKIDCFECHADRGLLNSKQGNLLPGVGSWQLSRQTYSPGMEQHGGE